MRAAAIDLKIGIMCGGGHLEKMKCCLWVLLECYTEYPSWAKYWKVIGQSWFQNWCYMWKSSWFLKNGVKCGNPDDFKFGVTYGNPVDKKKKMVLNLEIKIFKCTVSYI